MWKISAIARVRIIISATVKKTKEFQSAITLTKDGKTGDCKRIFGIMGLAVKAGNEITLTFDGEDEEAAYAAVTEFVKANL